MGFKRIRIIPSIKNRLLLYFMCITLIPTIIFSVYQLYSTKAEIIINAGENNYKVISNIMNNIEKQVEQANELTTALYTNSEIISLLKRSPSRRDIYDTKFKYALDSIAKRFEYMPVTDYILSLFVLGENGLDLRSGSEASLINASSFTNEEWFLEGKAANGKVYWGSISPNYSKISNYGYIIPQYRTVKDLSNGKVLGHIVIFFKPDIFSDYYDEASTNQESQIYLVDSQANVLSSTQFYEGQLNIRDKQCFKEISNYQDQSFFEMKIEGSSKLITYKKSAKTGWTLIEVIPMTEIVKQLRNREKEILIFIFGVSLMFILLSVYLSENFTRPIKTIIKQINEIAQGDFDGSISLNYKNEVGELGESVTKMKDDIKNLLHERIQKEKEKRFLEIQMLQSQINPHFLYNTLNSVKLMAAMRGADGIEKMIGSTGRILRAALGGAGEKITLLEELNILEDYMYIQKIQYRGKIRFNTTMNDENLLNCMIIRFILQPLVENAVLHGIGYKGQQGEIKVTVYQMGDRLFIGVWDDGVGISDEKIRSMLESMDSYRSSLNRNEIGISNVNRRIKLVYGEEYGLKIESKMGEYTRVTLELPIEMKKDHGGMGEGK